MKFALGWKFPNFLQKPGAITKEFHVTQNIRTPWEAKHYRDRERSKGPGVSRGTVPRACILYIPRGTEGESADGGCCATTPAVFHGNRHEVRRDGSRETLPALRREQGQAKRDQKRRNSRAREDEDEDEDEAAAREDQA